MTEVEPISTLDFNNNSGYLEGLVRGLKGGILKQTDYQVLVQCETLEGSYVSVIVFLRFKTSFTRY